MKKLSLLFFVFFNIIQSNAQYSVKWGPVYDKEGGMFSTYFLAGATRDNYSLIVKPKKDNTMLTFDYNHKLVKTETIPFTFNDDNLSPTEFFETSTGIYAYLPYYQKKDQQIFEFVSKMDKNGNFGALKEINSYEYSVKAGALIAMAYGFGGDVDDDVSTMKTSLNKKFVLNASSQSYTENKKTKIEAISIVVYDENFNQLWTKVETFEGKEDDDIDIAQYFIDDNGIVYAGAIIWKSKEEREKGIPNYDYKLYKISKDNIEEFSVVLEGTALPQDVGIFHGEDNNIYLGGLYTERGSSKHRANGVFYVRLNPETGKVVDSKSYVFTPELLTGLIKDTKINKGRGLANFDVSHLIFSDNGDFSFIAEENYVTVHTRTVNGRTTTYYVYHSNEIIIPRFSKDGNLVNIQKIDKDFSSQISGITSYTIGDYDNKIFLVFNDKKSRDEISGDNLKGSKNSRFTDLVVIDGEGKLEFWETLFSNKDIETEFYPSLSRQVQDSEILLLHGAKIKEYQFATILMD